MDMIKDTYTFKRKQGMGSSVLPIVHTGMQVYRGEQLGYVPEGKLGAELHTSVSGIVSAVTDDYIQIKADVIQPNDYIPITGNSIIELIKHAGIVGMGGEGIPTFHKLSIKLHPGGTIILNAAECEPVLNTNSWRLEHDFDSVYSGFLYAKKVIGAEKVIIAIKKKYTAAIHSVMSHVSGNAIKIQLLEDEFPMGEERKLVQLCLGKFVPPGNTVAEIANTVVINVETAVHICWAVEKKMPCITKDVTVAGVLNGPKIQLFTDVPIGILTEILLHKAGGVREEYGDIIMGGPFRGHTVCKNSPIEKTTNGIIVTRPFWKESKNMGLLICACGAQEKQMCHIAKYMGAHIIGKVFCKNVRKTRYGLQCVNPGHCPGQLQAVLKLKKEGAEALLVGNCTDCTNTVMSIAPKLGLAVYHSTDQSMRACGLPLVRKIHVH